jgi:hypothetical protein
MQIDQYGFEARSMFFQRKQLQPYRVVETASATFMCFGDEPQRPIHRITKNGTETVVEWAFGAWNDKETLAYVPINQTLEV